MNQGCVMALNKGHTFLVTKRGCSIQCFSVVAMLPFTVWSDIDLCVCVCVWVGCGLITFDPILFIGCGLNVAPSAMGS